MCIYSCLTSLTPCTFNIWEKVPPPRHNAVGVCNQVTFLILYYPSSRLIPLLHVINAPIQIPDIVNLTISFQFLNFSSQICLLFVTYIIMFLNIYIFLGFQDFHRARISKGVRFLKQLNTKRNISTIASRNKAYAKSQLCILLAKCV